jgi:polyisoprenoid-binding protein YceI
MRMTCRWKLPWAGALALLALVACSLPSRNPTPANAPAAAHAGTAYAVVGADSLISIVVYRAGALASVGHNHVVASHDLGGTVYVAADPLRSSFELHLPVATLTVDESQLRAEQASPDFPPDVSESAKEGTRHNMLGEALLDVAHSPQILLESQSLESNGGEHAVLAHVRSTVRGNVRSFSVPVDYRLDADTLTLTGDFPLRQSDLGLTPFSAMLGALQVQDEMRIRVRIVARAASPAS